MLGAIGYGIMGYFWQEIIYSFLGLLALTKMRDVLNATGGNAVVVAFVEALAGSVFVAAGLYWGVYLTNTKQRSLYRSTTVDVYKRQRKLKKLSEHLSQTKTNPEKK